MLIPGGSSKEITAAPRTDRNRLINCCSCPWGQLCYRNTKSTFHKLLPRMLLEVGNRITGYLYSPTVSQFNLDPFPLHLYISSTVLLHWDGSMKPCALRQANSDPQRYKDLWPNILMLPLEGSTSQSDEPSTATALSFCLEFLQSSPLAILHFIPSIMVASSRLHSERPNYSLFLTLIWSLVANAERSTWNVLSMSKCPTPSPRSSYREPEMTSPCEFPGCLVSEAHWVSHTCVSSWCLGNFLFCSTCRTGSCLFL